MTWSRALAAAALADVLKAADSSGTYNVFARPPATANVPALVVSRPVEVRYGVAGLGVDEADLPVVCLGPVEGEDVVDELLSFVRSAVDADPQLGGAVQRATPTYERHWRLEHVGGAEATAADALIVVTM